MSYKCRDSVTIGSVTTGSKQVFSGLSLNAMAGDYIGCYYTCGSIDGDYSGYSGTLYTSGEHIDPNDQAEYYLMADAAFSIHGLMAGVGDTKSYVYDGDGNRVKKIESGQTIVYINKYYEVNLTTGSAISYYYLGGRLVAMKENTTLRYVHQDHLTGTSLMTDTNGDQIQTTMKYLPFGSTRSGSVPTDKLFTGQRLDGTGLYYYGARYYDANMGRFISPDTIIPHPSNPQSFNRYSYCLNNPLKYIDPSGRKVYIPGLGDVENITMETYIWLMHMTPEARGEVLAAIGAWETLAGVAPELFNMMIDSDYTFEITNIDFDKSKSGLPVVEATVHTHTNYWGNPSYTVTYVPDCVWSPASALGVEGVSVYPFGVFVRYQNRSSIDIGQITLHEIDHRVWQGRLGHRWYADYFGEILVEWAYYGGSFWEGPYVTSYWEQRARRIAGQYQKPNPTPWWKPYWDSINNNRGVISDLITNIIGFH